MTPAEGGLLIFCPALLAVVFRQNTFTADPVRQEVEWRES